MFNFLSYPANIYLFEAINRNTRERCKICSKLTTKKLEWRLERHWRRSGVFIINFKQILRIKKADATANELFECDWPICGVSA